MVEKREEGESRGFREVRIHKSVKIERLPPLGVKREERCPAKPSRRTSLLCPSAASIDLASLMPRFYPGGRLSCRALNPHVQTARQVNSVIRSACVHHRPLWVAHRSMPQPIPFWNSPSQLALPHPQISTLSPAPTAASTAWFNASRAC
jgi:hypothetical protein